MKDYEPFAHESITVTSATIAALFTESIYNVPGQLPAEKATIYVNAGPIISFTIDGTTVTTGTGHAITSFMTYDILGNQAIRNFRTTSTKSGTAGSISVSYFR